jgi:hypothetical protein
MSARRNLVVRRERPNSIAKPPLVLSVKALPVSLKVRSPDVAVRSAVYAPSAHAAPRSRPDPTVLSSATRDAEPSRSYKKVIKLGSKSCTRVPITWKHHDVPTDSQILQLADQKETPFVLGFSALHWACELHRESVVNSIIERKLLHPDTFALHAQFLSFTPVFSAISVLWLRAEYNSEHGLKNINFSLLEHSCLSVMKVLADAGARLDFEAEVHLRDKKCVTLLHIAADYACLVNGRFFQQRQSFLLRVAQLLLDYLNPAQCVSLFNRKCKVNGEDAVSVGCTIFHLYRLLMTVPGSRTSGIQALTP